MILGFTGTRQIEKVSKERLERLELELITLEVDSDFNLLAQHGCAFGADSYFHELCLKNNIPIIGIPTFYMNKSLKGFYTLALPEPPLVRNKRIVIGCDVLIALPVDPEVEEVRSGTWSTIRHARRLNKQIIII